MTFAQRSALEMLFAEQIRTCWSVGESASVDVHLPAPEREYRFHPDRKWRFDFAWPRPGRIFHENHIQKPIAVEIEGGSWVNGAHSRGKGFEEDCEKYAEALIAGWRVLRVTGEMVNDGRAIALLRRLFDA